MFDTTSSNAGRLNGACLLLEQSLEREILFLVCRHHIIELVLQGVFLVVKLCLMTGLDILLFKRFKHAWENIDKSKLFTWISDSYIHDILKNISRISRIFRTRYHIFRWSSTSRNCF